MQLLLDNKKKHIGRQIPHISLSHLNKFANIRINHEKLLEHKILFQLHTWKDILFVLTKLICKASLKDWNYGLFYSRRKMFY